MYTLRVAPLLLAAAVPSLALAAGPPEVDLFAGYGYASVAGDDPAFEPGRARLHGAGASIGWRLVSGLSVVADASGHFGTHAGADLRRWYVMAGPRLARRAGRVTGFVQALAGMSRTRESLTASDLTIAESATDFTAGAGAGLDVGLGRRLAVRVQGDLAWMDDQRAGPARRVSAGLVLRAGR